MTNLLPNDAAELRQVRDRLWSSSEWTRVPSPTRRIQTRGEVHRDGVLLYTHEVSGEIYTRGK